MYLLKIYNLVQFKKGIFHKIVPFMKTAGVPCLRQRRNSRWRPVAGTRQMGGWPGKVRLDGGTVPAAAGILAPPRPRYRCRGVEALCGGLSHGSWSCSLCVALRTRGHHYEELNNLRVGIVYPSIAQSQAGCKTGKHLKKRYSVAYYSHINFLSLWGDLQTENKYKNQNFTLISPRKVKI